MCERPGQMENSLDGENGVVISKEDRQSRPFPPCYDGLGLLCCRLMSFAAIARVVPLNGRSRLVQAVKTAQFEALILSSFGLDS
jgi:hypothetical protein